MSRRIGVYPFIGGMNNVKPVHLLEDSEASDIRNLHLDPDGVWKDINNPDIMLDLSDTHLQYATKVVWWKPAIVPEDCIDDFVYVVFLDNGLVKLVYRGDKDSSPLFIITEDDGGHRIDDLGYFFPDASGESASKSYFVRGRGLLSDLIIEAPDDYKVSENNHDWDKEITIPKETANAGATEIFVKYIEGA